MEFGLPKFCTIRQAARMGLLSERHLRLREKQGRLPGIRSGNRYLVNVQLLIEQLDRESMANQSGERADKG